ncbi:ribonuclease HI [Tsukamurella tyrosinosolvens]|uniref:ribonuclease HI n=1 Tax=Tsukamurella tyrosinosolvens TaxID=57704 RepID=UPI001E4DECF6|nr:ribonuclease HI [Tsukamurella tyrosinosolvens]
MVLRFGEHEKQLYGGDPSTTNNRMELLGAITALEALTEQHPVTLHTDSQYVIKGITEWLAGWKRRGWKTSSGGAVKNEDLWRRLDAVAGAHTVDWRWVKGHAGHEGNELADSLATRGAVEFGGSTGAVGAPKQGSRGGRGRPRRRSGSGLRSGGAGAGRW